MATILEIAAQYRRDLAAREATAVRELVTAYGTVWQRLRNQLDALLDEVAALRAAGQEPSPGMLVRLERAQALVRQVESELQGLVPYAEAQIRGLQADGLSFGSQSAQQMVVQAIEPLRRAGIYFPIHRMDPGSVQSMVGFLADGSPLRDLLATLGPEAAQAVQDALIVGIGTGLGPREVARLTREAFGGSLRRALLVARTEMMRASRTAQLESFRANDDVIAGWVWQSALDERVCGVCAAMHGTFHTLDETLDSHVCCRCTPLPRTRTWSELGFTGIPDTNPQVEPGVDWFARQDAARQRRIIGPAKLLAYQRGELELPDLVRITNDPRWGRGRAERSLRDIVGEKRALELIQDARTGM